MNTRLRTSVDSLNITGGIWQEKASNLGVFEHSPIVPLHQGRGNLYILVETVGNFPNPENVQQRLISVAQERFREDGSVTNALREAIKAANSELFELNLNATREERGIAGITCVVLKDEEAFVGQAGPALLYHIGQNTFQRFPEESSWLSVAKLEDVDIAKNPPLGLRREIEPDLSRLKLQIGDVFLLAATPLAKLASHDEINSAATHRGTHTIRENLEALISGRDAAILIMEMLNADQASATARRSNAAATAEQRPGMAARLSSAVRSLFAAKPAETERSEPEDEYEEEEYEEEASSDQDYAVGIDLGDALRSIGRGLSRFFRRVLPVLAGVLPKSEPAPTKKVHPAARGKQPQPATGSRRWIAILLAIPVLVVLLYAVTRYQYERSRQAHIKQLLQTAEEARSSADISPAIVDQRAKLRLAITALDEALTLKPGDQEISAQRQTLQEQLDSKNYVSRLLYFGELKEFPDTESAKSELSAVIVHGIDIYVLDVGTDRVYKYLLSSTKDSLQDVGGEPVLVRRGDQRDGIIIDELLDIVWTDPGTGIDSNLLILDKKGHILQYDPLTGLKLLPVADVASWRNPVAAATFNANLYVLDPPANAVLKYEPTNAGYDASPSNYIQAPANANLNVAVDISIDGSVYVLQADGTITKYFKGLSVPFPMTNLDEPLRAAGCIFVSGSGDQEGSVYVADTGNQRILRFSKDGIFQRQYRGREAANLNALKSLYVDETDKKLYLTNGNKLYWVKLPD